MKRQKNRPASAGAVTEIEKDWFDALRPFVRAPVVDAVPNVDFSISMLAARRNVKDEQARRDVLALMTAGRIEEVGRRRFDLGGGRTTEAMAYRVKDQPA